uniref:Integrase, catalytic region, zinc finger, CCHC-type, peptidase aspartic, catalytic n=1 Tax=Tanacetum cinerariifolium TaxID=118510 RepID=A0A6L2NW30_TANCI|nr:hypothetical protein [Tanacetum cinerariifolium]
MSTIAEFMIVADVDNHPPMLDKPQYESWKSHMELYIQEDGNVRLKTHEELYDKEKVQADCDLKAAKIVLQGLPPDVYSLINHHKVAKDVWDRVKLLMQGTSLSKQERECKLYDEFDKFSHVKGIDVPTFLHGDDPIACINKAIAFLSAVFSPRYPLTNNQLRSSSNLKNQATVQDGRVNVHQVKGTQDKEQLAFLADPGVADDQVAQTIIHNAAFQTDNLDAYDFNCDDISSAKAILMANLSSCDSDFLSEDKANNESKIVNESLTAKLERYKERVKINKQRFNFDLSSCEKFIDSKMDDMIRMRNTKFAAFEMEIKLTLSKHELSTKKKFWLQSFDKNSKEPSTSDTPVKIKVPGKLPKKQFLIENNRLLDKIISQEIVLNTSVIICVFEKKNEDTVDNVDTCNKCMELEAELFDPAFLIYIIYEYKYE